MQDEIFKRECESVKSLGDQIGYGNMMDIASALWARELIDEGFTGNESFYPTILSNMKSGDLTVSAMQHRAMLMKMFESWGW